VTPVVRRSLVALGVVVAVLVGYYVVTVIQVWRAARADDARPSDAIIVLGAAQYDGAPSPAFAARLDHAADLFDRGVAPLVVVTGGKQPGDRFTEATAGADYLIARGVPDSAILRETTSRNSWESLRASARFLFPRGVERVVLVSDPFHSLRIRLTAEEIGFDAVTSPTRTSPIRGAAEWRRFLGEGARVALGRIFGFGRATRLQERRSGSARVGAQAAESLS
jgi:uncharacterized SAM-binding protein YcdF (DUF218 family)